METQKERKMTNKEMAAALEDLMNQWDATRAKWVKRFGTDKGFAEWFTDQVMEDEETLDAQERAVDAQAPGYLSAYDKAMGR